MGYKQQMEAIRYKAAYDALDNALIVGPQTTVDAFDSPREALDHLIDWEIRVANDPAVSEPPEAIDRIQSLVEDNAALKDVIAGIVHFCEAEMNWEFFRVEYNLGGNPSMSRKNAQALREYLKKLKQNQAVRETLNESCIEKGEWV